MGDFLKTTWNVLKILLIHAFIGIPYMVFAATIHVFLWVMEGNLTVEHLDARIEEAIPNQIHATIIISAILAFLVYRWMVKRRGRNIYEVCRFKKISLDKVVVSLIIGMTFVFFSTILINILYHIAAELVDDFETKTVAIMQANNLLIFLSIGIAAPFIEEIMFRGLIFHELEKKISINLTVVIQGILFGIYHLNPIQGLYASVLGIFLGFSLVWTGSIWAPILIHLGNNMFVLLLSIVGIEDFMIKFPIIMVIILLVSVFVILPLVLGYLYRHRVDFNQRASG